MNSNKEMINLKIRGLGYSLGCYDESINGLNKLSIGSIINSITGDDTSVFFLENNSLRVVEIMYVTKEVDLYLYDVVSYFEKYGNLEEALDLGTITDKQYREIRKELEG